MALNVYNSGGTIIDSVSVTEAATVSGTFYEIANTSLANAGAYGLASSLSTGGSSGGPYFSTFGVLFDGSNFYLGFSWDPTGNDPYGSFANTFYSYASPPTQATYSYTATAYLSPTLISAGDTAALVLTAQPVPEPASIALLATGGFVLTGFTRLRRKK
jgi:hypothetical protein